MGLLSAICDSLHIPLSRGMIARITLSISTVLILSDFISDSISLKIYWSLEQGRTLAILASVSLGLGAIVLMVQLLRIILLLRKGFVFEDEEDQLSLLKYLEITVESIPQLWISLYVLSSCEQHDVALYISAAISFLSIVYATVNVRGFRIHVTQSLLDYIFLYPLQAFTLSARILLLVYMSYNVKWWTALLIGLHCLVTFTVGCVSHVYNLDGATDLSQRIKGLGWGFLFCVLFIFTCFPVENILADFIIVGTFVIGNAIGVGVSYKESSEYCLYRNVIEVHVSLNVASIVVFAAYLILKHRIKAKSQKQNSPANFSSPSMLQNNELEDAAPSNKEVNMPLLLHSTKSELDQTTLRTSISSNTCVQINTLPTVGHLRSADIAVLSEPLMTETRHKGKGESSTIDNSQLIETGAKTKQEKEDESTETTDTAPPLETEAESQQ